VVEEELEAVALQHPRLLPVNALDFVFLFRRVRCRERRASAFFSIYSTCLRLASR